MTANVDEVMIGLVDAVFLFDELDYTWDWFCPFCNKEAHVYYNSKISAYREFEQHVNSDCTKFAIG